MSSFADPTSKNYTEFGKLVRFVRLPNDLPCDLLVATRKVDERTKAAITAKLPELQPIGADVPGSDVDTWVPWIDVEAEDARRALSELRRQAGSSTLPIVVDVESDKVSPVDGDLLDAARLAIRLAGTELVDRSQYFDYYKKSDIRWELANIHNGAVRLTVRGPLVVSDAAEGDSIAVNGCCLTVVTHDAQAFTADVMKETLDKTSLGGFEPGTRVNLERAVTAQKRLGGHIVQGHVDGTGTVYVTQLYLDP